MPYGLPRKIRKAFIVQALLASLAVLLGGYLMALVLKYGLLNALLHKEAEYYWQQHALSPGLAPPNTHNIRGYLQPAGQAPATVPEPLRGLAPGFHELRSSDELVLVDQQADERLYLVFQRSPAHRVVFWFGVLLILLAIHAVSWLTYRASSRLVAPVSWLARKVSLWDPRHPDAAELAPERLPPEVQGETRQLALALHRMAGKVTDHVARERNFTRDASHELRTPLTVIRMASDMALADSGLTPRLQRSLQRIQRAGRDMEAVIDAFLLLAREVDVEPQSELFDVGEVVRYEAANVEELLQGKSVQLRVLVEGNPMLMAPPRVMHVVVANLLRNACLYTDAGEVEVRVTAEQVVVRDTGIGMSHETLARIFEPFYRADGGRQQGVGLGLPIVRRLCERCGWRIELESREGQGTTATLHYR
ncbi:histidine kinase [Stenotrophomonas terrae]|uniref:histidine kinase n=1 Tax=Stenotrophomonas terrae TaxID=405446 RepID=A0A0R0BWT2_9GAMM|nr:HAMP domain-containing sensor histidine kinase [Stenotrophomonas terrae]KRG62108.1 histidine kinase [Stenotrophomonas terrae]